MQNEIHEKFELVMLDEFLVLFTCSRIDRKIIPEELFCYDVRHDDECQGIVCEIKPFILVNHWGTIISQAEIPLIKGRYFPQEDLSYIGVRMSIEEYLYTDLQAFLQEEQNMEMNM